MTDTVCAKCRGSGKLQKNIGHAGRAMEYKCDACNGTGVVATK